MARKIRKYTTEQREFFAEFVPGHSHKEIAAEFNRRFDSDITHLQVKSYIGNNKLNTGRTGRFEKGHVPASKGKKMSPEQYEKCKATMFKSGSKPANTDPIGTEKLLADGYIWVKIDDKPRVKKGENWIQKHRLIWEEAHGPIPDGHVILFLDGDRTNTVLENLAMVSQSVLSRLNQSHLIYDDPEATKAGIAIAEVLSKIGDLERGEKNG